MRQTKSSIWSTKCTCVEVPPHAVEVDTFGIPCFAVEEFVDLRFQLFIEQRLIFPGVPVQVNEQFVENVAGHSCEAEKPG